MDLHNVTIGRQLSRATLGNIDLTGVLGETPLERLEDLLPSRKLELSTTDRLNDVRLVCVLGPDTNENLSNIHTSSHTNGLSVRVTHTGGQTIGSGTAKHFVGPQDVEGVSTDANVKVVLSDRLSQMLVDGNTAGLESLGRNLLLLAHQVSNKGKEIHGGLLGTNVENADLGVGDSTAIPRLDVRLVLLVTVATSWTATHDDFLSCLLWLLALLSCFDNQVVERTNRENCEQNGVGVCVCFDA